jgi:hypothetical protein
MVEEMNMLKISEFNEHFGIFTVSHIFNFFLNIKGYFIISQCSRQETNTLSPEGLPMSNIAVYLKKNRLKNKKKTNLKINNKLFEKEFEK